MKFPNVRRSRLAGGGGVGKLGHAGAKYSKHPAIRHALTLAGFRADRRVRRIAVAFASVADAVNSMRRKT